MSLPFLVESDFVKRQTFGSEFSYFDGEWSELIARTEANFEARTTLYRDGVVAVRLEDASGVFSGVATLVEGDKLIGAYKARHPGEEPRQSTQVVGREKLPAVQVDVIVYRKDVLCEDPKHVAKGEWEIVSVNASPVEGDMPIAPMTLLANHFKASGGTDTGMSDAELIKLLRQGYEFWKDKAMVAPAE
jgi:hypothetical protein